MIIAIIVVAAAAGAGTWWFLANKNSAQQARDKALTQMTGRDPAAWGVRAKTAQDFLAKQDTAGGLEYYRQLIAHADNQDNKQALLLEAAQFAVSSKQYDAALGFMDQSDAINKTVGTAVERAVIDEAKGDKAAAVAQYKAAITMAQNDKNSLSSRYINTWQTKIEELSK